MAVLQSLINRLGKERGLKKEKKSHYNMGYSYLVIQPSTNLAQQGLTLLSGQNMFLSLWYSNSTLNAYAKISKTRKGIKKRKKSLILYGWESREQKTLEEYENENYYLLW